jgi:hypothetical protein
MCHGRPYCTETAKQETIPIRASGMQPAYSGGFQIHRVGLMGENWLCFPQSPDRPNSS